MDNPAHENILAATAGEIDQFIAGICNPADTDRSETDESPASVQSQDNAFTAGLVDDFFPAMKNNVQSRMMNNPVAKLALGKICTDILLGQNEGSVFFECGSTIALAVLAMRNSLLLKGSIQSQIALSTNSALVQTALYGLGESVPRLLYGDRFLNAQKYLGFFPIHPRTIQSAMNGLNSAKSQLQDAWQQMCRDGASFDVSLLTASKFHFIAGPFVGSIDNSFLKFAFYSSARDLRILVDGTKCLNHRHLLDEWMNEGCFESLLGVWSEEILADYIAKLFPDASAHQRETLMVHIEAAAHRNPQASVSLPPVFVDRKYKPGPDEQLGDPTEEIRVVDSWRGCVEQVLTRRGGSVTVYIAEPDADIDFERRLAEAIDEANVSLRALRSRLRIRQPECSVVYVHKPTRSLVGEGTGQSEAVKLWRCTYYLNRHERSAECRTLAPALA